jgi:hypothetical protein
MKLASFRLQLVAGVGFALISAGSLAMATKTNCDSNGACVTDFDDQGNRIGCTKASAGANCDKGGQINCSCTANTRGSCVCP